MKHFDPSRLTPEERAQNTISDQVIVIHYQTNRIDGLEQAKASLEEENKILRYENIGLKDTLKMMMTGDPQHD